MLLTDRLQLFVVCEQRAVCYSPTGCNCLLFASCLEVSMLQMHVRQSLCLPACMPVSCGHISFSFALSFSLSLCLCICKSVSCSLPVFFGCRMTSGSQNHQLLKVPLPVHSASSCSPNRLKCMQYGVIFTPERFLSKTFDSRVNSLSPRTQPEMK